MLLFAYKTTNSKPYWSYDVTRHANTEAAQERGSRGRWHIDFRFAPGAYKLGQELPDQADQQNTASLCMPGHYYKILIYLVREINR